MGSVMERVECPKCKGVFHRDYRYKTGEEHSFCVRCGFTQYARIRLDGKSEWLREDVEYPLDGSVVFGVKSDDELIWEKPLMEEIPGKEIEMFIGAYRLNRAPHKLIPDWIKPVIHLNGQHNIFHKDKNGEILQLFYIGNWFRFERDEAGNLHFYQQKAVWDNGELPGSGVLCLKGHCNESRLFPIGEKSKEEFLKMWDESHKGRGIDAGEYLTWFDPEAGILQCLYGEMPPTFDDTETNEEDY